jgi:hypothetical protein
MIAPTTRRFEVWYRRESGLWCTVVAHPIRATFTPGSWFDFILELFCFPYQAPASADFEKFTSIVSINFTGAVILALFLYRFPFSHQPVEYSEILQWAIEIYKRIMGVPLLVWGPGSTARMGVPLMVLACPLRGSLARYFGVR